MEFSWIPLIKNIKNIDWLYSRSKMLHLWIEILFRVSRNQESYPIGNEFIKVEPGQFISSVRRLAAAICCSREIVGEYIKILEHQGWLKREEKGNLTLFTILKKEYLPFLPSTDKKESVSYMTSDPSVNGTNLSPSLSTNPATNPATYKYNNINKKNNNNSPLLRREENLKFYEELRQNEEFWKDASLLLEMDEKFLRDKSELFFKECILKDDYKESVSGVKDHLVNWLKKLQENEKKFITNYSNTFKDNGKNTNNNRRGTEADTPRYRVGAEPKF